MNKGNIFRVASTTDSVSEYFNSRDSAINFIIDEFAIALAFRNETEGERLAEYMLTHNETPNQYPYKYKIEEISVNHEYDKPNSNSVYLVKIDSVQSCTQNGEDYLYSNYEDAREHYESIIDDDMSRYGENPKVISEVTPNSYDRWFDNENYCVEHLKVELIEFVPNKGVSIFSKK